MSASTHFSLAIMWLTLGALGALAGQSLLDQLDAQARGPFAFTRGDRLIATCKWKPAHGALGKWRTTDE